jgi:hypothetical protein
MIFMYAGLYSYFSLYNEIVMALCEIRATQCAWIALLVRIAGSINFPGRWRCQQRYLASSAQSFARKVLEFKGCLKPIFRI